MTAIPVHSRIGESWQQRIGALTEYEVVRDGNVFGANLFRSRLFSSEHADACRLLSSLMDQFQDQPLENVIHGINADNEGGSCYLIQTRHGMTQARVDPDEYMSGIWHDLTLVHGIGPVMEQRLKARGFATISDLSRHPRYRPAARRVMRELENPTPAGIMNLVGSRHPRSHPMVLGAAGFHEPEDFVFLDIETLGLFSRPVILIGVGTFGDGHLTICQYLLRSIDEEPAALLAALGHLWTDRPALVTYNGKAFDLPYLQERLAYYGLGAVSTVPHFDCLHFARWQWRSRYRSLCLLALEKEIFGIDRKDDVPGQMVPEFYEMYLRTGNCGPLVPIIAHNCQDVLSLARIFFHLIRETYGNC